MLNGNLLVDNDIDALGRLLKKTNTAPQGGVEISGYAYTNWTKKFRRGCAKWRRSRGCRW